MSDDSKYPTVSGDCKAVTRIFFGGVTLSLCAFEAEGGWVWEGMSPSPENFCIIYFKMVSFCACLYMFGINLNIGNTNVEQLQPGNVLLNKYRHSWLTKKIANNFGEGVF